MIRKKDLTTWYHRIKNHFWSPIIFVRGDLFVWVFPESYCKEFYGLVICHREMCITSCTEMLKKLSTLFNWTLWPKPRSLKKGRRQNGLIGVDIARWGILIKWSFDQIEIMSLVLLFRTEDCFTAVLLFLSWIFHDDRRAVLLDYLQVSQWRNLLSNFVKNTSYEMDYFGVKYSLQKEGFSCKNDSLNFGEQSFMMWSIYTSSVLKCILFRSV
jgi:hypothetical protein